MKLCRIQNIILPNWIMTPAANVVNPPDVRGTPDAFDISEPTNPSA